MTVRSRLQDASVSAGESVAPLPGRRDTADSDDTERERPSQPPANVSRDTCLTVASVEPQACPASLFSKLSADAASPEECSQAPMGSVRVASSQQPSPEDLMSLGIKVRDFAYENTLPAIVPVPRVPRQVQPAPRALKRPQRDWDNQEGSSSGLPRTQSRSGQAGTKKPRSLERQPTEPLQEPAVHRARTLERLTVKRVCSIIALSASPRTRPSASPPTSPLSHLQTPSTFPFVVHVADATVIPASQLHSESQPVLYTTFTLEPRPSSECSPVPSPPLDVSPAPVAAPFPEPPSPIKRSGAGARVRKRRGRGTASTAPSTRYQLRQRPIPSPRASTLSRCSHQRGSTSAPLPRPTRRMR